MATASGALLAGRYRTIERLGAGGMATVYLAEDERLGRRVAVKRLHAESPEDMGERFAREARVGASLNHPNVVSVYDTVTDENGVLIVMEYVEGPTFGQALADGLTQERALAVLAGVAAALDHVHEGGVVHRDVKPANVLIRGDGTAKLTDLGIATASEGSQITRTGTVLGTPAYMAPEQLEGGGMGPAVDVYALAAMAFEALCGRKARTGRTPVEIAHRATTEPPPDLREAWPEAPAEAAELLARGMDRDPALRPTSAGLLVHDLALALEAASAPSGALVSRGRVGGAAAGLGSALTEPLRRGGEDTGGQGPETAAARTVHGDPQAPGRSRRRPLVLLAAGGALLAAGAVALASSSIVEAPAPPTPPSARRAPAPVPPPEPKPRTPDQTVGDFYQLSVADEFRGAWRLAGPGYRAQLQGFESYKATFSSLRDIEFRRLDTVEREGSAATVAIRTVARHTDRTDRCEGTYEMGRPRGGDWRIDRQSVACTSGPASGGGGDAGSGASAGAGSSGESGEGGGAEAPAEEGASVPEAGKAKGSKGAAGKAKGAKGGGD